LFNRFLSARLTRLVAAGSSTKTANKVFECGKLTPFSAVSSAAISKRRRDRENIVDWNLKVNAFFGSQLCSHLENKEKQHCSWVVEMPRCKAERVVCFSAAAPLAA